MTDLLQMIGRAGRPQFDDRGIAYIMAQQEKTQFYQKFLYEPFPVESCLLGHLHDHINAEIVGGTIRTTQDGMNYISNTYFYKRLTQNPRFYGLTTAKSSDQLNAFLYKITSGVLMDLHTAGCIMMDEKQSVESTELGNTASFYYLSYKTVQHFSENLHPLENSKLNILPLIELMTEASEFDGFPVRHNEEVLNAHLAARIPLKLRNTYMADPHLKAALLILSYLLDIPFPITDFVTDTKTVLDQCLRVIQGMIEISKNKGYLNTVLLLINILQMIVQGLWATDPPLLQLNRQALPSKKIMVLRDNKIIYLPELLAQSKEKLAHILGQKVGEEVFEEAHRFPKVFLKMILAIGEKGSKGSNDGSKLAEGEAMVVLNIKKVGGEKNMRSKYGKWKEPAWYIIIGNESTNQIIRCTRFTLHKEVKLKLTFVWPEIMKDAKLKVYLLSDSYLSLDQIIDLDLKNAVTEKGPFKEYRQVGQEIQVIDEDSENAPKIENIDYNPLIEKDLDNWL